MAAGALDTPVAMKKHEFVCLVHLKSDAAKNFALNKVQTTQFETPAGIVEVSCSVKKGEYHLYSGYTGHKWSYKFKLNGKSISQKALENL